MRVCLDTSWPLLTKWLGLACCACVGSLQIWSTTKWSRRRSVIQPQFFGRWHLSLLVNNFHLKIFQTIKHRFSVHRTARLLCSLLNSLKRWNITKIYYFYKRLIWPLEQEFVNKMRMHYRKMKLLCNTSIWNTSIKILVVSRTKVSLYTCQIIN